MNKSFTQELKENIQEYVEVDIVRTPETIAAEIRMTVRTTQKIMLDAAILIGNNLLEAKELVSHGDWTAWLKENVNFSQRKANTYTQIAREYGEKPNSQLNANLSYTNALKLLALPEDEREAFIENNDVEDMTVSELEEEIRKLKEEKEGVNKQLEEIQAEKELIQQGNAILIDEKKELEEKIEGLEVRSGEEGSDEEKLKIDEALKESKGLLIAKEKELEKEQAKAAELQAKIDNLNMENESVIEKAREETAEKIKAEFEERLNKAITDKESALEMASAAERKVAVAANENIIKLKLKIDDFQLAFNDAVSLIEKISETDTEQAEQLRRAISTVLETLNEQLEA